MSKQKAILRKDASDKLIAQVAEVLDNAAKRNRYSVSAIFNAHNTVFGLKEAHQSCNSCLLTRVAALRKWYEKDAPKAAPMTDDEVAAYLNAQAVKYGLSEEATVEEQNAFMHAMAADPAHPAEVRTAVAAAIAEHDADLAANADKEGDPDNIDGEQYPAPAEGATRYPMGEGITPLDFTPNEGDALKGTIKAADGTNVKAGTYTAADGTIIAVSVGNKATIKDDLL